MRSILLIAVVSLLVGFHAPAEGCTCFSVDCYNALFVGRNYDWDFSDGLVLVNKRGLEKHVSLDPTQDSRTWTSTWGSLTFNQYGRDFPTGGINERGLVIEILWLEGTVFPPADDRLGLDSVQWIQYQLDTAATVAEVVSSLTKVRVSGNVAVHFYVADRSGQAAAIEFLDGKSVIHRTGESMPVAVLTNNTYQDSEAYLRKCEGWGGRDAVPAGPRSLDRFARAAVGARALESSDREIGPEDMFRVLANVAQQGATQWSIVYDLKGLRVHFRTLKSPGIKSVALYDLDFSCNSPVKMVDIDTEAEGDLSNRWADYKRSADRDLIGRSYAKTEFLRAVPAEALDRLAEYPETARCTN